MHAVMTATYYIQTPLPKPRELSLLFWHWSIHIPLTSVCCVHSNIYHLDNIKSIRYLTVVYPILSTSHPRRSTTLWPLVLRKPHCILMLETLVPLGKNQFPITDPLPLSVRRQQAIWSVRQSRALPPSPISSRVTILLFWYVVPLREKLTLPGPGEHKFRTSAT